MYNYYVYEWIRLDTNLPFYVGKGKGNRAYEIKNNKHFKDVLKYCNTNNIEIAVVILDNNLTEKEAFQEECWYINEYICNYGFKMCNMNWGGEGGNSFSFLNPQEQEIYRTKMSKALIGKNKGRFHTKESKNKMSKSKQGKYKGEKNPMYGNSCTNYMTEDEIILWNKHKSESMKGKHHSEETKRKMKQSSTRRKSTAIELDGKKITFNSRKDCERYLKDNFNIGSFIPKKLLKTQKEYTPRKCDSLLKQSLKGMKIYFITQEGD